METNLPSLEGRRDAAGDDHVFWRAGDDLAARKQQPDDVGCPQGQLEVVCRDDHGERALTREPSQTVPSAPRVTGHRGTPSARRAPTARAPAPAHAPPSRAVARRPTSGRNRDRRGEWRRPHRAPTRRPHDRGRAVHRANRSADSVRARRLCRTRSDSTATRSVSTTPNRRARSDAESDSSARPAEFDRSPQGTAASDRAFASALTCRSRSGPAGTRARRAPPSDSRARARRAAARRLR